MTVLLVGISVRAAAESAVASGYPVCCLDAFGDVDLAAVCPSLSLHHNFADKYLDAGSTTARLYNCSLELEFDEVIYSSGFENHPEYVEGWERKGKTVYGNDGRTLRAVRDWEGLFEFLDSGGIGHPETHLIRDPSSFDFGSVDPEKFLVKPILTGGGHGIRLVRDLLANPSQYDWAGKPLLLQQRLRGTLASVSFISGEKCFRVLSTTLQLVGNRFSPFRYAGNISPLAAPSRVQRQIGDVARRIAIEYNLKGSNGIDFILTKDKIYVLEVNPRIQGSLEVVEKASGVPVIDAHIRSCRGKDLPRGKRNKGFWGRRVVFSTGDILTPPLSDLRFIKDIPKPGTKVKAGGPVCTVLGQGNSVPTCRLQLEKRENRVINRLRESG